MAQVYRPVFYVDPTTCKLVSRKHPGAVRRVSPTYRIRYRDPNGVVHKVKGYRDRKASEAKAAALERRACRLAEGVNEPSDEHAKTPLPEHLEAFRGHLLAKGNTAKHAAQTIGQCQAVLDGCRAVRVCDLTAAGVTRFLHELSQPRSRKPLPISKEWFTKSELIELTGVHRMSVGDMVRRYRLEAKDKGRKRRYSRAAVEAIQDRLCQGHSVTTRNAYLTAIKAFTRWLWREHRIGADPLAGLSRQNPAGDRRRERRALSEGELRELLEATRQSEQSYQGLAGPDRYMLYALAAGTGFRAGELAALTPADFDLAGSPPTLHLAACYAKNGREAMQPLQPDLANALRDFLTGKPASEPLWPGGWKDEAADMLRVDLEAAGIPYADADGRVCDFHSLRHAFITLLSRSGVHPKMAQELARHSDIRLTMNVYTHAGLYDLAAAVEGLPSILPADRGTEANVGVLRATGTEGKRPVAIPPQGRVSLGRCLGAQVDSQGDSERRTEIETRGKQDDR